MTQPANDPEATRSVQFTVEGDHFKLQAQVTVPCGSIHVSDLLPFARGLSDQIVGESVKSVGEAGLKISCKKGCGACCRNLVAISEVEARRIRNVVEELPEPRRSEIRTRFAVARQRLEKAGLLDRLRQSEAWTEAEFMELIAAYFPLGIPCPFLEAESCSIYAERPVTCREFLVVSPPEHCAQPSSKIVRAVRLPLRVFNALARMHAPGEKSGSERAVPLILAPEWAEAHADEPPAKPGPDLLRDLLRHLSVKPED